MPQPELRRGSIVLGRRGEVGIVWIVGPSRLTLFSVFQPSDRRAGDIECDGDAPIWARNATIRVGQPRDVQRDGQVLVGDVPGALMCRVCVSVARLCAEMTFESIWSADAAMAARRRDRCVDGLKT